MDTEKTVIESKNTLPYEGISYDDIPYEDPIDKVCGLYSNKNSKFSNAELAEKRFKYATSIMYALSLLSILGGIIFYISENNIIALLSGIFYLSFTFTFHKLKMPISLAILTIILLGDRIYTSVFLTGSLIFLLILGVPSIIAIIQAIRSKKHLSLTDKRFMQKFVLILISLGFLSFGALWGIVYISQKDGGWTSKNTDAIKNMLYQDIMGKDESGQVDKQLINEFATSYSVCAIKEIKKTFPDYNQFILDLNTEGGSTADQKLLEIKSSCFTEAKKSMLQGSPK